jgi:Flp pilus assembly protein CpaB
LNRRVLIGILIAVVGIGLIGLGILAINTVLRQSFAPRAQPAPVVETTQDVVITSHDMAVGAVLNREDIQLASVPVSLIPRDALQTIEAALGKIVTVHLIQGEMVLQHHLADPTNVSHDIGYIIGENEVLMAFPSTDLLSTLGVLQRGDNVDIFATMTAQVVPTNTATIGGTGGQQQAQSQTFTFDAFQRIQISAIVADVVTQSGSSNTTGTAQSTPNPADVRVRAYLLALNAQDALVLKNMRDAGVNFDIVLRSPTSNQLFDVSPVTEEYLVQRFKLQIPR